MNLYQCPKSIAIEAFRKGIKRDTRLFIELTIITSWSLDAFYKETQKFVNMERELKSGKSSLNRSSDKPTISGKEEEIKPYMERCPNPSHFEQVVVPKERSGTWGELYLFSVIHHCVYHWRILYNEWNT